MVEHLIGEGIEDPVEAVAGRGTDADVEVGAAAFNDQRKVFDKVVLVHGEWSGLDAAGGAAEFGFVACRFDGSSLVNEAAAEGGKDGSHEGL